MKDYYKILNIEKTKPSTTTYSVQIVDDDIKLFYKKKILVFKDLPFLTKQMILDIKDIKRGKQNMIKKYTRLMKKILILKYAIGYLV